MTIVCGCATSRAFTSQAVQLNSPNFDGHPLATYIQVHVLRQYLARCFLPELLVVVWSTPALSCASGRLCFVDDGSGADSMVYTPPPLLSGLKDCPLFIGTHMAPLPFRLGHFCDSVRPSICIQRKHAHRPANPSQVKRNELTPRLSGSPQTTLGPHAP